MPYTTAEAALKLSVHARALRRACEALRVPRHGNGRTAPYLIDDGQLERIRVYIAEHGRRLTTERSRAMLRARWGPKMREAKE